MANHWLPPDIERVRSEPPADLGNVADRHAGILARYWDDTVSYEANLEIIRHWLKPGRCPSSGITD